MRRLAQVLLIVGAVGLPSYAHAAWEDRSAGARFGFTVLAAFENIVPGVSTIAVPRCLPGYIVCKLWFAGFSVVAATEHIILSGGGDMAQTRAILHRGFAGDWILTGRNAWGDVPAEFLPDPGPVASSESR